MAGVKFILTNSSKLDNITVTAGNLIFCEDVRKIYVDGPNGRKVYDQIMILQSDSQRESMIRQLVSGFYFCLDTNILWRLDNLTWIQITCQPDEKVVYGTLSTFPRPGREGVLYMTDTDLYHWRDQSQSYVNYCAANPEWVEEI